MTITSKRIYWNDPTTLLVAIASHDVIRLSPDNSLLEAVRLVAERRISSILIVDEANHPLGIITERNILCAMRAALPPETVLRTVMSSPVITVPQTISCRDAYRLCLREGIRHLVVVDGEGSVVAVASETDFRLQSNVGPIAGQTPVLSVMSRSVTTLRPDDSLQAALRLMETRQTGHIVAVDRERPVGIITERDAARFYATQRDYTGTLLKEVMTSPVVTVSVDTALDEAMDRMQTARVKRLAVIDGMGRLVGMLGTQVQTRAMAFGLVDNTLDQERDRLRRVLNAIPDLVWLKDAEGAFLACNQRIERLMGAREADILGKTDYDFMEKELADFFREQDRNVMDTDLPSICKGWAAFADDGHQELIETIKTPVRDAFGGLIGILGIGRDITRLHRLEEQYRHLFAHNPAPMFIHERGSLALIGVNEAFTELYGFSREEALALRLPDLFPDAEREAVVRQAAVLQGYASLGGERHHLLKDGSLINVEACSHDIAYAGKSCRVVVVTDITERKHAEENLRRQIAVTAAINRVLQGSLHARNVAEVASICLSEAEELTGSKFGWIGEINLSARLDTITLSVPGWEFCRITDAQELSIKDMEITGIFGRVLKDGKSLIANEPGAHPDRVGLPSGHPELTSFLGVPLKHDGLTVGMVALGNKLSGYTEDDQKAIEELSVAFMTVLERKRADDALKQAEEKYRSIFDNAVEGIFQATPEGQYLSVNPALSRMCGFQNPEEMMAAITDIGSQLYVDSKDRERIKALYDEVGVVRNFETQYRRLDGESIWVSTNARAVRDEEGRMLFYEGTIEDITKRKKAELALDYERTTLRTLIQAIPDPVWAKDPDGLYLSCNPSFESLYGALQADIIGKTDHDFLDKETADAFREYDCQAAEAGGPRRFLERFRFPDSGEEIIFETTKAPLYDSDGKLTGVLGIARDITEILRNQRELSERVKEQRCLYEVVALTEDTESPLDEQLKQVVQRIAAGWQYPDITAVRLEYAGTPFSTPNFVETPWRLTAEATTQQGESIRLVVAYLEGGPPEGNGEGPFFEEERSLAEAIVQRLAGCADRRHATEALREHQQFIATMFAQTTDAIVLTDPLTKRFVSFNNAAHLGLGYTREEFSCLSVMDVEVDHTAEQIGTNMGECIHTAVPSEFETRQRHKDGTLRDVVLTLQPISLGGRSLVCAVWRDITEQKARERRLKARADRLQLYTHLLGRLSAAESAINGELDAFSREMTELLSRALGIERVSVWLFDEEETRLECVDLYEAAPQAHSRGQVVEEEAFRAEFHKLKTARYVDASEPLTDPRTAGYGESYLKPLSITSLLDCSIISGGRNRGIICFEHVNRPHQWEEDEITFGCQVADQLGMALLTKARLEVLKALRQNETILKHAQTVSLTGHWHLDIQHDVLTWSDETCRIFGVAPGTPLTLEDFVKCVHPYDRGRLIEAWNQALRGAPYHIVHRIVVGKKTKWIEERAELEFDAEGKPVVGLGIVQDITLNKEAQDRIYRLNRIYAMISGTSEAIVRLRDAEALFREICRIAVDVGGFRMAWVGKVAEDGTIRPAAVVGAFHGYVEHLEIAPTEDRPASMVFRTGVSRIINDIAEDPAMSPWSVTLGERGIRSAAAFPIAVSGRTEASFQVYADIQNFFDNQEVELFERLARNLGFALEFAAAEAKARKERSFRQTLMESVAGLFYAVDPNGRLVLWNRRVEEVTQRSAAELSKMAVLDHFDSRDQAATSARIQQAFSEGESTGEAMIVARDGSRAPYFFNTRRVVIDGRPLVVGTAVDITEKVRIARELEEYRTHLEELVDSRTAELETAMATAEAASQAKSSFLANMSHEIRTPMNAVIGFAHLMKRDPLTPRQLEQLDLLSSAARYLLQILNDILDLSKIEAHKITLEVEDFEPARVVDHMCAILATKVAAKELDLLVDLDHIPPVLRGDGLRVGQILLNLVSNAVKFTDKGSIAIVGRVVDHDAKTVTLRFEVRDTGIGMTGEQLERLFQAFEQADSSTTRRFGGTGLGLAISKRLTELMNGRIGVESESGRGSVFWVEIPFEKSKTMPKAAACLVPLKGMRALVIDDLEDARETLVTMLSEFGMRVDAAASGEAGLRAMVGADRAGDAYELLILDYRMPGLSGIDTLLRLQSLQLTKRPSQLMVTAYGDQLPREEAARAGVTKVLAKPVTPSVLYDALEEVVSPSLRYAVSVPAGLIEQELKKRRGADILLAEDSAINREVTRQLLEAVGMNVSVAENGKIAVDLARTTSFDLIFMDVQMPVMDGLDATKAIRGLAGRESVPVLAMTAHAFGEDRDKCLQAGMNDHVAKPVEPEALYESLVKWLPVRPAVAQTSENEDVSALGGFVQPGGSHELSLLEAIDGLDVAAGLRLLQNDVSRYSHFLRLFAERHADDATILKGYLSAGEVEAVHQTAHALKGTAGTLGARRIERLAFEVEKVARERADADLLRGTIERLAPELAALVAALRRMLPAQVEPEAVGVIDWPQVADVLARLEPLLATDNTMANDLFEQFSPLLIAALRGRARQLGRQIQDFDYADALQTLRAIQNTVLTKEEDD